MKKTMWIISFISLIGTAFSMQFLPDKVPMHFDISGNVDRWGSKYEMVIGITGAVTSAVLAAVQGFMTYKAYSDALPGTENKTVDMNKIPALLIGVLLIVLGNFMTKTRLNRFVGFRTKWSMYNDVTWEKSNRFGSYLMIAAGACSIIAAVFVKNVVASSSAAVALVVIAGIVTAVYSHRIYKEETATEKEKSDEN